MSGVATWGQRFQAEGIVQRPCGKSLLDAFLEHQSGPVRRRRGGRRGAEVLASGAVSGPQGVWFYSESGRRHGRVLNREKHVGCAQDRDCWRCPLSNDQASI